MRTPWYFPIAVSGKNYAAAVFLDGKITGDPSINSIFRKARPGDILQLYTTGLAASPAGVFVNFQAVSGVTVKIGNTLASTVLIVDDPNLLILQWPVPVAC